MTIRIATKARRTVTRALICSLAVVASACSHQSAHSSLLPRVGTESALRTTEITKAKRLDPSSIEKLIDPSVPTSDRAFLRRAMSALRSDARVPIDSKNFKVAVIDGSTGRIYYNRLDLKDSIVREPGYVFQPRPKSVSLPGSSVARIGAMTGRMRPNPQGRRSPLAYLGNTMPDAGTGPYRRIYTYPNSDPNSYTTAGIEATVSTQCNAGNGYNFNLGIPHAEAGHSYLGGWGATGYGVDAGLIYNRGIQPASSDDYSPFFAVPDKSGFQGIEFKNGNSGVWHVPCSNNYTTLTFYVDETTVFQNLAYIQLMLDVVYFDTSSGTWQRLTDIYYTGVPDSGAGSGANWFGWTPVCNFCVMKRMTSIAQKQAMENLNNGDTYAATWSATGLSCGFFPITGCLSNPVGSWPFYAITPATIKACEEYPDWFNPYNDSIRDCSNTPNFSVQKVVVSNFQGDYSGETDTINLAPTAPSTPPSPSPPPFTMTSLLNGQPSVYVSPEGLHLGANITNAATQAYGPPQLRSFPFPNNMVYRVQLYDGSTGSLVWDSAAGLRYLSSIHWMTWAPDETKHFEKVYTGPYNPNGSYYYTLSMIPIVSHGVVYK